MMKKMAVILCIVVLGIAFLVMPGSAQAEDCNGDDISEQCQCSPCAENLNLQVTPTCDGLEFTWNDVQADEYILLHSNVYTNEWFGIRFDSPTTSFFIPNFWGGAFPAGTYSFTIEAIFPDRYCLSNIVCDVEMPTTCTNAPEFPSIFLPATMIIGFLGAVLLIQRTREH